MCIRVPFHKSVCSFLWGLNNYHTQLIEYKYQSIYVCNESVCSLYLLLQKGSTCARKDVSTFLILCQGEGVSSLACGGGIRGYLLRIQKPCKRANRTKNIAEGRDGNSIMSAVPTHSKCEHPLTEHIECNLWPRAATA